MVKHTDEDVHRAGAFSKHETIGLYSFRFQTTKMDYTATNSIVTMSSLPSYTMTCKLLPLTDGRLPRLRVTSYEHSIPHWSFNRCISLQSSYWSFLRMSLPIVLSIVDSVGVFLVSNIGNKSNTLTRFVRRQPGKCFFFCQTSIRFRH